jgi:hypothetical protein
MRRLAALCLATLLLLGSVPAAAQCALCGIAAEQAADSPRAARAFNAGILVLLVPALGLVAGIGTLAWTSRRWDGASTPRPRGRG